jgi:predicted DNA-binding transcriptional regulator YafY
VRAWIINTFALNNLTNISAGMRDRVIFEEIPEGMRYLSTIINAMKDSRRLVMSYQGFKRTEPHTFLLDPYCLKVFKQRWYLVGKPEDHPEEKEPRVYALDRVKDLAVTDKAFHLPAAFKAATFFENQFGIDRSKTKAEKIRVKVANWDANFLISLPLHTSQRVVESNDEYTVFEYKLAPTYDFIMELRKYGSKMEVLAPQSLREEFAEEAEHLAQMYS